MRIPAILFLIAILILPGCGPQHKPLVRFAAEAPVDSSWRLRTVDYVRDCSYGKIRHGDVTFVIHGPPPIPVDPSRNLFHVDRAYSLTNLETDELHLTAWSGIVTEALDSEPPVLDCPYEIKCFLCRCEFALLPHPPR